MLIAVYTVQWSTRTPRRHSRVDHSVIGPPTLHIVRRRRDRGLTGKSFCPARRVGPASEATQALQQICSEEERRRHGNGRTFLAAHVKAERAARRRAVHLHDLEVRSDVPGVEPEDVRPTQVLWYTTA